ncbi:hypothetical protein BRC97_10805 [Halobacteriales archaeon QS_6_71_20]|nr:MAG: hypothetical protein BRC97_10805 [Halobacteriales archaeon QS_6_71_20]
MSGADVEFRFTTVDDEERFVREYLADVWPRFEAADHWETGWFWRYGGFAAYDAGPDGGLVRIVFEGDPDGFVAAEGDRWDGFDGLASWSLDRYEERDPPYDSLAAQQREAKGERAGEWDYRLKPLVARFVLACVREFDDPAVLPADGESVDGNYGLWAATHYLWVMTGRDWYDETDVCLRALRNRVLSIAHYRGADAARTEYERLLSAWEAERESIEAALDERSTGEGETV